MGFPKLWLFYYMAHLDSSYSIDPAVSLVSIVKALLPTGSCSSDSAL